jgi:hypothetical protein
MFVNNHIQHDAARKLHNFQRDIFNRNNHIRDLKIFGTVFSGTSSLIGGFVASMHHDTQNDTQKIYNMIKKGETFESPKKITREELIWFRSIKGNRKLDPKDTIKKLDIQNRLQYNKYYKLYHKDPSLYK